MCSESNCKVRIELEQRGYTAGMCDKKVITDIVESISAVRFGSVELRIQDSHVVQIDTVAKRRLN